jgi:hypothetical protein
MITALLIVLGLVALVLILALFQPAHFRYERRAILSAAPADLFPYVNELTQWPAWSPWEKMDPAMKRTFEGPGAGVGAVYAWDGNRNIGAGRMTITESRPNERICIRLEFYRPFACCNQVEFVFTPIVGGTSVCWSMAGANKFPGRIIGLFMNMDKMCGTQFEEGLASLGKLAARQPAVRH